MHEEIKKMLTSDLGEKKLTRRFIYKISLQDKRKDRDFMSQISASELSDDYHLQLFIAEREDKKNREEITLEGKILTSPDLDAVNTAIDEQIDQLITKLGLTHKLIFDLKSSENSIFCIKFTGDSSISLLGKRQTKKYRPKGFKGYFDFQSSIYSGEFEEELRRLLKDYLWDIYQQRSKEYSEYPKFLKSKFRIFEDYIDAEFDALTKDCYKPNVEYTSIEIRKSIINENDSKKEIEFISINLGEEEGKIPKSFQIPKTKVKIINKINDKSKNKGIPGRISDFDDDEVSIIIRDSNDISNIRNALENGNLNASHGFIVLEEAVTNTIRKKDAIRRLQKPFDSPLQNLVDFIMRSEVFFPQQNQKIYTTFNRDIRKEASSEKQYNALQMIQNNQDLTLIQGPPGSGKTTLIVELIKQSVHTNKRILMCAPTHVAINNIIERLDDCEELNLQMVRIGSPSRVPDKYQKYLLRNVKNNWQNTFYTKNYKKFEDIDNSKDNLDENDELARIENDLKAIQNKFFEKDFSDYEHSDLIQQLIINSSNVVCGTNMGVVSIFSKNNVLNDFDLMIVDESSKTTVLEFLVPAVRARKWVIIGDQNQLPPYIDQDELEIVFNEYFRTLKGENKKRWDIILKNFEKGKKKSQDSEENQNFRKSKIKVDPIVKEIMVYFQRFYDAKHFLGENPYGSDDKRRVYELFGYDRHIINKFTKLVDINGSCYHYFFKNIDKSRKIALDYQYRMPPLLGNFINDTFYSELEQGLKNSEFTKFHGIKIKTHGILESGSEYLPNMSFISTSKHEEDLIQERKWTSGKSWVNYYESYAIFEILKNIYDQFMEMKENGKSLKAVFQNKEYIAKFQPPLTIGVITFYSGQYKAIKRLLYKSNIIEKDRSNKKMRLKFKDLDVELQISIVDRFQGQEKDIILIPLTRSNTHHGIGFLKSRQRVNVAFSRAKHNLIIVGNFSFFEKLRKSGANYSFNELVKYCKRNRLIFDLKQNKEFIENVRKYVKNQGTNNYNRSRSEKGDPIKEIKNYPNINDGPF